ncbi:MAG: glycosyltransferase [Chitinophagaceae bacterium]
MKPLVSICCITYNHGNYIRRCIEGFLLQKTSFPIEILIFDDASTDNTQSVIQEYSSKYSNIVTFLQTENQWQHKKYGLLDWLFPNAKGEYIAICEGDDYWSDENKLQKQVDFLETHSNFIITCTNAYYIEENKGYLIDKNAVLVDKSRCTGEIQLNQQLFENKIMTLTAVFRNVFKKEIPAEWFNGVKYGDWAMFIYLMQYGKIMYFNDITAVYRKHSGGSFSLRSEIKQLKDYILTGEIIRKKVSAEWSQVMIVGQKERLKKLLIVCLKNKDFKTFFSVLFKFRKLLF